MIGNYQTRCSRGCSTNTYVTNSFIHRLTRGLWKYLQDSVDSKLLEVGTEELRQCSLPLCVMCHMSPCQILSVTHQMVCVMFQMSALPPPKKIIQLGGASRCWVCYQRQTSGHGDYMTETAQWGQFSENQRSTN